MDEKNEQYYRLWADFLKISKAYETIVREVNSASLQFPLPCNFSELDFSDDKVFENWTCWIWSAKGLLSEDVTTVYAELLYTTYPFFQDIKNVENDMYLYRIDLAHKRRAMAKQGFVRNGSDSIVDIIEEECRKLVNQNADASALDLKEKIKSRFLSYDAPRGSWKDLPGFVPGDDFYTVFAKIVLKDTKENMVELFRKHLSSGAGVMKEIFECWESRRLSNVFMEMPPDPQLDATKKHLQFLIDRNNDMSFCDISKKYYGKEYTSSESAVSKGVRKAKRTLDHLERTGNFLKEESAVVDYSPTNDFLNGLIDIDNIEE